MKTHIVNIGFANTDHGRYALIGRSDGSVRKYEFPDFNKYGTPYTPKWYARLELAWNRRYHKSKGVADGLDS